YIEDYPFCGLFTFHGMNGFVQQPTEYYLRPVNLMVRYTGLYDDFRCYGNKLEMEVSLGYVYYDILTFSISEYPALLRIRHRPVISISSSISASPNLDSSIDSVSRG